MEDYELERARAWDDTIPKIADTDSQFEWQEVRAYKNGKKKSKPQNPPAVPSNVQRQTARTAAPASASAPGPVQTAPLGPAPAANLPRWPLRAPLRATRGRRQQPQASTRVRHRPQPTLLVDHADNEATLAWRARKPPACSVRIPDYIVFADRLHNQTPTYFKLASDLGTFIYSDDIGSGNATLEFKIWGDAAKAAEAKAAIMTWVDINIKDQKSAGSAKFPKVVSLTPTLRERANRQWLRDLKRSAFRQDPPTNMLFEVIGSFLWPIEEYRPEEVFGMAYEALDPIRESLSCYITFHRERSSFQVYGRASNVQSGLLRIRKTFFNLCARQLSPVRTYSWHSSGDIPTHVYLGDYALKKSPRGEGNVEEDKVLESAQLRMELNTLRIRENISSTLCNLHYLRGDLQLRLRLGMFYLESYKEPEDGHYYELQEFEDMLQATQFSARASEELGGHYVEGRVLELMRSWDDICSPQEALTDYLSEIRPSYCVEFTFDDSKGDLCLSMVYTEADPDGNGKMQFTETEKKWTRLHRDSSGNILDASLFDLATGSAWQFDLHFNMIEEPLRLPLAYQQFADKIRMDPSVAPKPLSKSGDPFVNWNPFMKPQTLRQVVRYQAMIIDSDYTLQVSQYQDREFHPHGTVEVHEPRWSLDVFRMEWDAMFAKNANLGIGTTAEWNDDMEHWFPKDWNSNEEGFRSLLEKMKKIEKRVRDAAAQEDEELIS